MFDTSIATNIMSQNAPKYLREDLEKLAFLYIFRIPHNDELDDESKKVLDENTANQRELKSFAKYPECLRIRKAALSYSTHDDFEEFVYPRLAPTASIAEQKFYRIMKHILYDYSTKCFRKQPILSNHERTFFSDKVVPIFNYFADGCSLIQFEWFVSKQLAS